MDKKMERIFQKRVDNKLDEILRRLEPFKRYTAGVVVESTYNWYWLVDGLMEAGYHVHLSNPSAMVQYEGMKCQDDKHSAFWLAHMLAIGNLKEGYIYPKAERPIRDLLRKRLFLVWNRTSHILSLQAMIHRNTGERFGSEELVKLTEATLQHLLKNEYLVMAAMSDLSGIAQLSEQIKWIQKTAKKVAVLREPFHYLLTIPGVGDILSLTIMYETGNFDRFASDKNFSSYARCVPAVRTSNNKRKGDANRKNGNRYLAWAFAEAAVYARNASARINAYYQRKKAKTNAAVASKAVANKLSKAAYYVMRNRTEYNENLLFGPCRPDR